MIRNHDFFLLFSSVRASIRFCVMCTFMFIWFVFEWCRDEVWEKERYGEREREQKAIKNEDVYPLQMGLRGISNEICFTIFSSCLVGGKKSPIQSSHKSPMRWLNFSSIFTLIIIVMLLQTIILYDSLNYMVMNQNMLHVSYSRYERYDMKLCIFSVSVLISFNYNLTGSAVEIEQIQWT